MACRTNSFLPATLVLMEGGLKKPIADIQIGDMVMATDPETGERGSRRVTDTIVGAGVKELVDIEIDGHVVTATDRHPFWIDDVGRWVDAEDLEAGDILLLADGDTVAIDSVREYTELRRVHNLTVDGIHTYYVLAGDDPVLVHNCAREIALGLDRGAAGGGKALARQTGASWYKNWARDGITSRSVASHFGRAFHQAVDRADAIRFSLDGIDDIAAAVRAGAAGFAPGNFTFAELRYILT